MTGPTTRTIGALQRLLAKTAPVVGLCGLAFASSAALAQAQTLGSATTPDAKVRVDILSLKRTEGETVTLRLQVTNNGGDSFSMTLGNSRLVDLVGRRTYTPGLTSPSCYTPASEKLTCYAVYGAPPAGTQKINVQFYEKMDLITGVPVGD